VYFVLDYKRLVAERFFASTHILHAKKSWKATAGKGSS
jgi:hypothetical protein